MSVIIYASPAPVHWSAAVSIIRIEGGCWRLLICCPFILSLLCLSMDPLGFQVSFMLNLRISLRLEVTSFSSSTFCFRWSVCSPSSWNSTVLFFLTFSLCRWSVAVDPASRRWEKYWPWPSSVLFLSSSLVTRCVPWFSSSLRHQVYSTRVSEWSNIHCQWGTRILHFPWYFWFYLPHLNLMFVWVREVFSLI